MGLRLPAARFSAAALSGDGSSGDHYFPPDGRRFTARSLWQAMVTGPYTLMEPLGAVMSSVALFPSVPT